MTLYQYQAGVSLPKISLHSPLCLEGEVDQNQVQGYLMPDGYFLPISSLQATVLRDSLVETTKLKIGGQEDRSVVQGIAAKHDKPSLIPGIHMVEGEN